MAFINPRDLQRVVDSSDGLMYTRHVVVLFGYILCEKDACYGELFEQTVQQTVLLLFASFFSSHFRWLSRAVVPLSTRLLA